jgi:IS30 family transposase
MMTQEEFVDVKEMRDAGMTYAEIAEKTGYHRTTIAKWIKTGGPPERRAPAAERVVVTGRWQRRIAELLEQRPALLSTSVHDVLVAEGFGGSYATVVREARRIRGPRFRDVAGGCCGVAPL